MVNVPKLLAPLVHLVLPKWPWGIREGRPMPGAFVLHADYDCLPLGLPIDELLQADPHVDPNGMVVTNCEHMNHTAMKVQVVYKSGRTAKVAFNVTGALSLIRLSVTPIEGCKLFVTQPRLNNKLGFKYDSRLGTMHVGATSGVTGFDGFEVKVKPETPNWALSPVCDEELISFGILTIPL